MDKALVWHFKCNSCDAEIYINEVLFDLSRECMLSCIVCGSILSCKNFDPYCIMDSGITNHMKVEFQSENVGLEISDKGE